jgi:propionyl-CoA synthetase
MVRERIGAVACFKQAVVVNRLPKTRSGKTLRGTMRAIANGDSFKVPATCEDVTVLHDIKRVIEGAMNE